MLPSPIPTDTVGTKTSVRSAETGPSASPQGFKPIPDHAKLQAIANALGKRFTPEQRQAIAKEELAAEARAVQRADASMPPPAASPWPIAYNLKLATLQESNEKAVQAQFAKEHHLTADELLAILVESMDNSAPK